jgi:acyl-coenzyme A thioesterase PaaI-like protein
VEEIEPGSATCYLDVENVHLSGKGALHGGVASLIDDTMRLSAATLVGLGKATIVLDVHFLGAV